MSDTNIKNESALLEQDELLYYQTEYDTDNTEENKRLQAFYEECKVYNLKSFMALDLPKAKMILDPIITEGSLSMLHAYRGIGKSFFAKLSHYPLFNDKEMGYTENLMLFAADMQIFPTINIAKEEIQHSIGKVIESNDIKFVVFDNISSLTTIDELDSVAWLPIQDWLISLRKKNIAVLLIHHSGKNGGQRGISKREDVLDLVMSLKDTSKKTTNKKTSNTLSKKNELEDEENDAFGGKCQVMFEKNRNLGGKNKLTNFGIELIDLDDGSIAWVDIYATVKQLKEEGCSCREIQEITGISKSRVSEICRMDG